MKAVPKKRSDAYGKKVKTPRAVQSEPRQRKGGLLLFFRGLNNKLVQI